ncbi:hypothetical protein SAMN05216244_3510 [Sediminibacillus halophilus]|uniref:Uncharacterized protein n=1 Tax=Sediminibacillus halophilus TaxID=482461 RepID=A0A1G9WBQ3_9BACI|nr:hypothetical protein SAMN05216244_3510 [Sediminibacillus halophilus]
MSEMMDQDKELSPFLTRYYAGLGRNLLFLIGYVQTEMEI